MKLFIALAAFTSFSAFAACPETLTITLGKVTTNGGSEISEIANKTFQLTKKNGSRVCYYRGAPFKVMLQWEKNAKFVNLTSGDQNHGGRSLEFSTAVAPAQVQSRTVKVKNAKFSHKLWEVDEDGCSFGQTPCVPMPRDVSESVLDVVTIKLK